MQIDPNRLKELRQGKELSRAQLADRSKISQRQITRIEGNAADTAGKVRERTVTELAKALGVDPGVLTGDLPMPDAGSNTHSIRGVSRQVSARLQPEASLACTLVERRYGVSRTTLFNAAPLMFVLLAEGSFIWRREKLEEIGEAADRLCDLGVGHLAFAQYAFRAQEAAGGEEESIRKRDLFGEEVSEEAFDMGYDRSVNNPFADYLRHLTAQIGDPGIVEMDKEKGIVGFGPLGNFPEFTVCGADFAKFTGGSAWLNMTAKLGYLHLDRIPEELLADDALDKRIAWLEERLDEQLSELSKEQMKDLQELLSLLNDSLVSEEGETAQ